jgi:hypothetical protein
MGLGTGRLNYDEIRRRSLAPMSPEEKVWLEHLSSTRDESARRAAIGANRERWSRFLEAFRRAVEEVPAPYPMCPADLFGQW